MVLVLDKESLRYTLVNEHDGNMRLDLVLFFDHLSELVYFCLLDLASHLITDSVSIQNIDIR
jgi:hypothetical protein